MPAGPGGSKADLEPGERLAQHFVGGVAAARVLHVDADGTPLRTSMRAERSLPVGMRTIAPRLFADALIWFGAS